MRTRFMLIALVVTAACDAEPAYEELRADIDISPIPCLGVHAQVRPRDTSDPGGPIIGDHPVYPYGAYSYQPNRYHQVYRGTYGSPCQAPPNPKLVVFLPGHRQEPRDFDAFLRVAVDQGYHVIGLDYANPKPLSEVCAGKPLSCYAQARHEIVFGFDTFAGEITLGEQSPQDSITSRLRRLLVHLHENVDPSGDWDHFLLWDASQQEWVIRWNLVVVAGHGGYEAYLAKHKPVARVILLGTVGDGIGDTEETFISAPSIVPAGVPARYFGLINTLDTDKSRYLRVTENWEILGVPVLQRLEGTTCAGCTELEKHDDVAKNLAAYGSKWRLMLGTAN